MTLFAFLGGAMLGLSRLPGVLAASQRWAEWFGSLAGEVWLRDGAIGWEHPEETPYTARHGAWRVDFHDDDAEFQRRNLGPEAKGVWISPTRIYAWFRSGSGDDINARVLFADARVLNVVAADALWPEGWHLDGDELVRRTRHTVLRLAPALVAADALRVFVQVLFYTFIFAVIPYLLKSPLAAGGFRSVFAFYLYASIPPLAVACVYASLNLPYLDFNTFFVVAFIVYLVAVVWRMGRSLNTARNP